MKAAAIIQGYDQNILQDAVITASASPMTGYSLSALGYNRPDWRVRFSVTTLTVTWTIGSPAQGDILVVPVSNLESGGSPAGTIRITNGAGLSQTLSVPAVLRNGFTPTLVVDLTVLTPNAVTRTSNVWHLVIHDNPSAITLGGAVAIYGPKTALVDRDFQWGYTVREQGIVSEVTNDHGTTYRQDTGVMLRSIDLQTVATAADGDRIQEWFEGNNGRGRPGLLWFDPDVADGYFGVWQPEFTRTRQFTDAELIQLHFDELSKGVFPLL